MSSVGLSKYALGLWLLLVVTESMKLHSRVVQLEEPLLSDMQQVLKYHDRDAESRGPFEGGASRNDSSDDSDDSSSDDDEKKDSDDASRDEDSSDDPKRTRERPKSSSDDDKASHDSSDDSGDNDDDDSSGDDDVHYILDHEWRIHRERSLHEDEDEERIMYVQENTTVAQARDWCRLHNECVRFLFHPKSYQGMDTIDYAIFLANHTPPKSPLSHFMEKHRQKSGEWITHVLHERDSQKYNISEFDGKWVDVPYQHCCHFLNLYKEFDDGDSSDDSSDDDEDELVDEYRKSLRLPTLHEIKQAETIDRVPCNITRQEFVERFESKRIPVILEGCADNWPAQTQWDSFERLSSRFANDTLWNTCGMTNQTWEEAQEEMVPGEGHLCIFDQIPTHGFKSVFDKEYDIPQPFRGGDIYVRLGINSFPAGFGPMAWWSIGQRYAASGAHQDYHLPAPDQWNTLVRGTKWWILFPPSQILSKDDSVLCHYECSEHHRFDQVHWFISYGFHAHKFLYEDGKRPLHVLQREGDTLYIPDKWMHSLLNMDDCIAVTRAYGSITNLQNVWKQVIIRGTERDWTKLYYTVLNAEQRKIARDVIDSDRTCVMNEHNKLLCDTETTSSFYSKVKRR